ncbi:MAG: thioredoxin 1 [Paraglaciecola sp.]
MYKTWSIFLLVLTLVACQTTPIAREDAVGLIDNEVLLAQFPQFNTQYHSYQPTPDELQAIKRIEGKTLVVLFGTWCHDSEREVPRLLKTLALADVNLSALQLLAVNPSKQLPGAAQRAYDLRYTPTFILFEGDRELGRIIERPAVTLAQDLAALVPGRD